MKLQSRPILTGSPTPPSSVGLASVKIYIRLSRWQPMFISSLPTRNTDIGIGEAGDVVPQPCWPTLKPHVLQHTSHRCLNDSVSSIQSLDDSRRRNPILPLSRWPTRAKLKLNLKLRPTAWSICLKCHSSNGRRTSIRTSSGLWNLAILVATIHISNIFGHPKSQLFVDSCKTCKTQISNHQSHQWNHSSYSGIAFSYMSGICKIRCTSNNTDS